MSELRCGPCRDAGRPDVIAHTKGLTAGQSQTGKAVPPMCWDHKNGLTPQWLKDKLRDEGKEVPGEAVLRNHAVSGKVKFETPEVKERVADALRNAGLSATSNGPRPETAVPVVMQGTTIVSSAPSLRVPCTRKISPQCEIWVPADKLRKVCAECWSYSHRGMKKKGKLEQSLKQKPTIEAGVGFTLSDEQLVAMLDQIWETTNGTDQRDAIDAVYKDLPVQVKVRLVQSLLNQKTQHLHGDLKPPDGANGTPKTQELDNNQPVQDLEEQRAGYASMH